jgi:beta-glucosidase
LNEPGAPALRVGSVPAQTAGGRLAMSALDKDVQEGARRILWRAGSLPAAVELQSQTPVDLARETNGDMMLVMTVRLNALPGAPILLGARCGELACGAQVALPELAGLQQGQWQDLAVPLKCLLPPGSDAAHVSSPFVLSSRGALSIGLASVTLGTHGDVVAQCLRGGK